MANTVAAAALHDAIVDRVSMDRIRNLVGRVDDINGADRRRERRTPLMAALQEGNEEAALLLIERGADVKARDAKRDTALHWACRNGQVKAVAALLAAGARADARGQLHGHPVHDVVKLDTDNTAAMLDLLLAHGANINARDKDNYRPIDLAVNAAALRPVELLLTKGAAINDPSGRRYPLMDAVGRGYGDIVELLLAHGADVNVRARAARQTPLHLAATIFVAGDTPLIEKLIRAGADVNARDEDGMTPLHEAVERSGEMYYRVSPAVKLLLENGADPEILDRWGCSARLSSALVGDQGTFDVLADWEANYGPGDALGQAMVTGRDELCTDRHLDDYFRDYVQLVDTLLGMGVAAETLRPFVVRMYNH